MSYLSPAIETPKNLFTQAGERALRLFSRAPPPCIGNEPMRIATPDQIDFHTTMAANGLPCPHVAALFNCAGRTIGEARSLHSEAAARRYLSDPAVYPLLFRPVSGSDGGGTFSAISYEKSSDAAVLGNGALMPLGDLVRLLLQPWARGYLFQTMLRTHPDVEAIAGARTSGLRIMTVGADMARASLKIHAARPAQDYFTHDETGCVHADIDLRTGRLRSQAGLQVPLWNEALRLVMAAIPLFPGLTNQQWDIALCPRGPVALSVSTPPAR